MNNEINHGKENKTITPEDKTMIVKDNQDVDKTSKSIENRFERHHVSAFQIEIRNLSLIIIFKNS